MPWHDIGLMIIGESAQDVARHFIEYWFFAREREKVPEDKDQKKAFEEDEKLSKMLDKIEKANPKPILY